MKIRSYSKGFTLVEMAVVIVILGLMAALILPGIFKTIERNRLERGRAGIEALKNEVIGYARATANKVLPELIEGFRHERDPWGNRADYHFDPALTTASICDATGTQLSIQRDGSSAIADIAFVVVSSGKNMNFETTPSPPSTTLPYTVIYHELGVRDASFSGYEFDDIIAFVSLNELKGSVCNTPASSATPPGNPAVHLTFDTALDTDPLVDAFGTGASTVTMVDGTGIGEVLALDGTQNQNFVRITPPSTDAEDYCEYTVMGWFRTQNPTQAPTNRMQIITSRRPNIGGFVNTWAVGVNKPEEPRTGNDEPRHPLGEAFWAASGVDVGRNLIRMHTSLSDGTVTYPTPRPTSSSGTLPLDYATKRELNITHLDDRWHFFAVNFEAGGTSTESEGTCSPGIGTSYTARMYISDHNEGDPDDYVDANYELFSRQATGLTAGPDVSYGAASYRIYLGQLAWDGWAASNLFEGYLDEFLIYLREDVVVQGDDPSDPAAKSAHDYIVEWYDATRCSYVQNAPGCP